MPENGSPLVLLEFLTKPRAHHGDAMLRLGMAWLATRGRVAGEVPPVAHVPGAEMRWGPDT